MRYEFSIYLVFLLLVFAVTYTVGNESDITSTLDAFDIYVSCNDIEELQNDQLHLYLDAVGFRESSNNYMAVNRFGYLGRYQFSRTVLRNLGYSKSYDYFLKNPYIQDEMMLELLRHNIQVMGNYLDDFSGTIIDDVIITKSGILAAAHLIGPTRTKIYLDYGLDYSDGNGTPTSSYIKEFSGYHINL